MGFVIINMLINTIQKQEDSPLGSTANARIRSSFLQLKAKAIKDCQRRKKGLQCVSV